LKKLIKKKILVTGCAGFIGSHLCEKLISKGYNVTGIDNLSTGKLIFIKNIKNNKKFKFLKVDLFKEKKLYRFFKGNDVVFHLAANADVKNGFLQPKKDLEQNTIVTSNVLEAMRKNFIKKIIFASTGSIYGEPKNFPTKENNPFPIQTSLYGSSKLASEALIQSYCSGFGFNSTIFRFVSIMGSRYTHGHLFDFYKQLLKNKKKLKVLGNGLQKKSYLHVQDCINAMIMALKKNNRNVEIYNLGTNKFITVKYSIKTILKKLKLNPKIYYSGGKRGWIGDSPKIYLDTSKIKKIGWKPKKTIEESIKETIHFFIQNKWLFK